MRAEPTEAERALWRLLRAKRLEGKWRRQQPIGPYIVDLVYMEARLIVEADGSQHADSPHDAKRDAWLKSQGFRILRFWNTDILTNIEGVAAAIAAGLASGGAGIEPAPTLPPLPGPPPQGGRETMETRSA